MILSIIISCLNGLILILGINHFKLNKQILFGGIIGIISLFLFIFLRPYYLELSVFLRVLLWISSATILYKINFPKNKIDSVLFRVLFLIVIKVLFERIIFKTINNHLYNDFFGTIYSWIPFLCISILLDNKTQNNIISKIHLNILKFFVSFLGLIYLIYAYYFILINY